MIKHWLKSYSVCLIYTFIPKRSTFVRYSFDIYQPISIIFDRNIYEKVDNRKTFHFPTSPKQCFYRAMLCIRGTSHGPVSVRPSVCLSVCLSVTSRCSTKTTKRRITKTTPHDSPVILVFCCQRSLRNSTGVTPYGGTKCRWGGSKSATFDK